MTATWLLLMVWAGNLQSTTVIAPTVAPFATEAACRATGEAYAGEFPRAFPERTRTGAPPAFWIGAA